MKKKTDIQKEFDKLKAELKGFDEPQKIPRDGEVEDSGKHEDKDIRIQVLCDADGKFLYCNLNESDRHYYLARIDELIEIDNNSGGWYNNQLTEFRAKFEKLPFRKVPIAPSRPLSPELSKIVGTSLALDKEFFPERYEFMRKTASDCFKGIKKEWHQEYMDNPNDFFKKKFRADYLKYKETHPYSLESKFQEDEIKRLSEMVSPLNFLSGKDQSEVHDTALSYIDYLKNLDTKSAEADEKATPKIKIDYREIARSAPKGCIGHKDMENLELYLKNGKAKTPIKIANKKIASLVRWLCKLWDDGIISQEYNSKLHESIIANFRDFQGQEIPYSTIKNPTNDN
jgi:hypothetical protein